jgi:ankyrin repeat protein
VKEPPAARQVHVHGVWLVTNRYVTKAGIFGADQVPTSFFEKAMGRRRSKWKDQAADRSARLLQIAKAGDCDALKELLAAEWPALAMIGGEGNSSDSVQQRRDFLQLTHDHNESTALHLAASEGHAELVHFLLSLGAGEIHLSGGRKRYARTPLHEAAISGHLAVCKLLVEYGFLVDCHTTRARTPLMYAVKGNHVDVVRFLVGDCGASINEQNEMGMTPLYIAAQDGHVEIVKYLVSKGADVNLANRTRHTPLHEAVAGGFLEVVSFLLDHGADKHAVDAMGVTIWHEAAGNGSVDLLNVLVQHGVSLHPSGEQHQVDRVMARHPFHYAAVEGRAAFIEAMLAKGLVDVNMTDADNCTAVYYAAANGHADVLKVLLAHGGDPNVCSIRRSPLHCAVEWRRLDCIRLLLSHGALIGAKDKDELTPMAIAQQRQDAEVVACLEM